MITAGRKSHQMALNNSTNKIPRGGLTMYSVKRARDVLAVFIVTWMDGKRGYQICLTRANKKMIELPTRRGA